uniref:ENTH domain-containing protein n=1 Tax=Araucaria cunninghamii TaxID=56994 RepID=A0A0D6R006_ARACU
MKLRRLVGIVKDNAAVSRAITNTEFSALHIAILRATSHEESPPQEKHVAMILSAGSSSSRLRAARCVAELLKRLTKTRNWAVALKSLIVVHRTLREGSFIFQDQLSLSPFRGGRNYLNMVNFRDCSSPAAWQASSWVRCYARYVDQWLSTCRVLGTFLGRGSTAAWTVTGLGNDELAGNLAALRDLLAAACDCCHQSRPLADNPVVSEGMRLVFTDAWQLEEEALLMLEEVQERMVELSPREADDFLRVVEGLGAQQKEFRNTLIIADLVGPECAHVTERVGFCLARVGESLRTVSGFTPLVTREPKGRHVSQSARFVRQTPDTFRSCSARMEGSAAVTVSAEKCHDNFWHYNGIDSLI